MDKTRQRLIELREKYGLTQGQVAEYEGTSQAHISQVESGARDKKAWQLLGRLARRYRTSADYLLGLTDDPRPGARVSLSEEEAAMLELWRGLSPGRRNDLLGVGRYWLADEERRAENLAKAAVLYAALRSALVERHGAALGEQLYQALVIGDTGTLLDTLQQAGDAV